MLDLDIDILTFLNGFIGKIPVIDSVARYLNEEQLFKATPLVLLLTGAWFIRSDNDLHRRTDVLLTFIGSFAAMATARALALLLPFRARPLHNPTLDLQLPEGMMHGVLESWSSMPSDHAALAFSLATGIFLLNRTFGVLALLHATFLICLPRLYLSLHYPSDLIAGALVGISVSIITLRIANTKALVGYVLAFEQLRPAIFYMLCFFVTSQMVEMFDGTRHLAKIVFHRFKETASSAQSSN